MQSHYPSTSLGHSNLAGGDMGSVAVKASLKASALEKERQQAQMHREAAMQAQIQAQRERDAQLQKEKEAQREAQLQAQREAQLQAQREGQRKMAPVGKARRGQTSQQQQQMAAHVQAQQAQVQSQMQMQMQGQQGRLTRSTGKRRADDGPANGTAGAEEKARPRSRGRGEDEGQDVYGTGPSRPHHQSNQSHPPRQQQQQQMYVEKWQQDQYGVNGNYSNTPYGQSVVSSPSDAQPNGRNTPGGLVRSSTMPTGGSIESGMGLSVSEVSGDIGRPSNKDKGQNMWRDKEGRLFVVSGIFSTFSLYWPGVLPTSDDQSPRISDARNDRQRWILQGLSSRLTKELPTIRVEKGGYQYGRWRGYEKLRNGDTNVEGTLVWYHLPPIDMI
jgi:hypothetical protein